MADIFISYARADRSRIEKLAEALESHGLSVWWDRKIEGGAHFGKDIERELDASKIVVVAWSEASIESPWVLDEAASGRDNGKLVPLRFDENLPPLGFRQQQAVDLSGWKGAKGHAGLAGLIETLRNRVNMARGSSAEPAPVSVPARRAPGKIPMLVGGLAALLFIAAAGWWFMSGGIGSGSPGAEAAEIDRTKSVAILPFRDLSPGGDQQWFTDGLADEITSRLSRTPDIVVAPSSAAFAFRDSALSPMEIASELAVEHILSGSVRRTGVQMRVTVELVRQSDGELVWSEQFDRTTMDAIEVQENIAVDVARALETVMDPEALAQMADIGTNSVEAYEAYLKGTTQSTFNDTDPVTSYEYFQRAYTIDPGFTAAHLAAAQILIYRMSQGTFGWSGYEDALERDPLFLEEVRAALAGSEEGSWIHGHALALRDRYYLRFKDVETRLSELHRQYPNELNILEDLAMAQIANGNYDGAEQSILRRVQLNDGPTGWSITQLRRIGKAEEAVRQARMALEQGSDAFALDRAIGALAESGLEEEARQALERFDSIEPREDARLAVRFYFHCILGQDEDARRIVGQMSPEDAERWWIGSNDNRASQPFDRDSPPYVLLYWGYIPDFDTTGLPKTRAALDRAGIAHDQPSPGPGWCGIEA
ncbi:TIR domain-containing protein [Altererythrobacter sp.]|uniref:TIR domain-containing protein n=1 Tax=Altererythrobacter sp. TaxID=1872480 RepID=UPI003D1336FD